MGAKEKYQERMKRIDDALAMKEPDRVPLIPFVQTYCVSHYGHTMAEAMYDPSAAKDGVRKYLAEYEPDANYGYGAFFCGLGPVFDKVGLKMIQWAG